MRYLSLSVLMLLTACVQSPRSETIEFVPGDTEGEPGREDPPNRENPPDDEQIDREGTEHPDPPVAQPCEDEWRIDAFSVARVNDRLHFQVVGQKCDGDLEDYWTFPFFDQNDDIIGGRCRTVDHTIGEPAGSFRLVEAIGNCSHHPNVQTVHMRATFDGPVLATTQVKTPIIVERGAACSAAEGRICAEADLCGPDRTCRMPEPPQLEEVEAQLSQRTGALALSARFIDINGDYSGFEVHFRDADGNLLGEASLGVSGWPRNTLSRSLSANGRLAPVIDPLRIETFDVFGIDSRGLRSEPTTVRPTALPELERGAPCTNLEGQCAPGLVCDNQTRQCADATRCAAEALPRTRSLLDQEFTVEKDEIETWAVDLPPGLWRLSARVWGNERPDVPMTLAAVGSCDVFAFRHSRTMFVNSGESLIRLTTPETIYLRVTRYHGADRYDLIIEPAE